MSWVGVAFDTCLLHDLEDGDDDEVLKRIEIITSVRIAMTANKIKMLLDTQSHIANEYWRVLVSGSLARRFVTAAVKSSAVTYVTARPTERCINSLRSDHFDDDDVPFIGAAQAVGGFYVTTEKKHLQEERRKIIQENCGVTIVSLIELSEILGLRPTV